MRLSSEVVRILDSAFMAYVQDTDRDFVTEKDWGYRPADHYHVNAAHILPLLHEMIEAGLMEESPNPFENRAEYRITAFGQSQRNEKHL